MDYSQEKGILTRELRQSTSWFYWIGGLSIINTLIIYFGGNTSFIVGLGVTQFVDGILWAANNGEAVPQVMQVIAIVASVFISGVFCLFGYLGSRGSMGLYGLGVGLYALDGLIFLVFKDYLSLGFHIFALVFLAKAFGKARDLKALDSLMAAPAQPSPAAAE